jgi:hypothetical protein
LNEAAQKQTGKGAAQPARRSAEADDGTDIETGVSSAAAAITVLRARPMAKAS